MKCWVGNISGMKNNLKKIIKNNYKYFYEKIEEKILFYY